MSSESSQLFFCVQVNNGFKWLWFDSVCLPVELEFGFSALVTQLVLEHYLYYKPEKVRGLMSFAGEDIYFNIFMRF